VTEEARFSKLEAKIAMFETTIENLNKTILEKLVPY